MNEKTYHPNGSWSYTHEGVRRAYLSIIKWFDYLFTYQNDKLIPNTTNTCDGHFSHIKDIVRIHRGLHKSLKQKVLDSIFLESTIAPKLNNQTKKTPVIRPVFLGIISFLKFGKSFRPAGGCGRNAGQGFEFLGGQEYFPIPKLHPNHIISFC
jgi:hypothetical protein